MQNGDTGPATVTLLDGGMRFNWAREYGWTELYTLRREMLLMRHFLPDGTRTATVTVWRHAFDGGLTDGGLMDAAAESHTMCTAYELGGGDFTMLPSGRVW